MTRIDTQHGTKFATIVAAATLVLFSTGPANAALGPSILSLVDGPTAIPTRGARDADKDGVPDTIDNCINVANPSQRDSDQDGYGNICDADFDQDCVVSCSDLSYMEGVFYTNDAHADLNGDKVVNFLDLAILKANFLESPGPSGQTVTCN